MLTFDRPDWIDLRVPAGRFDAARGFYGRLLTLEADGPPAVFRAGPRQVILRGQLRADDPRGALIDLQVPDLLAATEALLDAGLVWLEELTALPDAGWSTDLVDPFGVVWRLVEAGAAARRAAMTAFAARYLARLTHPGRPLARATPSLRVGRFGHCAEREPLDLEPLLGPPHLHAFDGDRTPGAVAVWRFEVDDGTLVELAQPAGGALRLYADPPDLRWAASAVGLPTDGWQSRPAEVPPSQIPGPFKVMRQDDNGNAFEILQTVSDYEAERWLSTLEARGHKQTYWLARVVED